MNWLLIAGGMFFSEAKTTEFPEEEIINHTLIGEPIPAKQVVTRNRWGTPMLPTARSGYNLIQSIEEEYIARSLVQPPKTNDASVIFRPDRQGGDSE